MKPLLRNEAHTVLIVHLLDVSRPATATMFYGEVTQTMVLGR